MSAIVTTRSSTITRRVSLQKAMCLFSKALVALCAFVIHPFAKMSKIFTADKNLTNTIDRHLGWLRTYTMRAKLEGDSAPLLADCLYELIPVSGKTISLYGVERAVSPGIYRIRRHYKNGKLAAVELYQPFRTPLSCLYSPGAEKNDFYDSDAGNGYAFQFLNLQVSGAALNFKLTRLDREGHRSELLSIGGDEFVTRPYVMRSDVHTVYAGHKNFEPYTIVVVAD